MLTGQESNNRKYASLFDRIRCWELSLQNFVANYTVPWLKVVDSEAAWNIYMVDPGGLRLKFLAESFPIFTFPAGPRSPGASDSWRSEGEISSGPSQTHTSHSRPFHQSRHCKYLGMLSILNLWMSSTFNFVSDPALMVVFLKTFRKHLLPTQRFVWFP